jgi:hypothetical protein
MMISIVVMITTATASGFGVENHIFLMGQLFGITINDEIDPLVRCRDLSGAGAGVRTNRRRVL